MNKITGSTEAIFSHAVALNQTGRMKNIIGIIKREIFILNFDHTVLLKFQLKKSENPFSQPLVFRANDYDSATFYEEDGKIIFVQKTDEWERKAISASIDQTPQQLKKLFEEYDEDFPNKFQLNQDILELLEDNLSHIEISAEKGKVKIIQREIYSGKIIELNKISQGFGISADRVKSFDPIGMRTNDFASLFSFNKSLKFFFPSANSEIDYCKVVGKRFGMEGIIAFCKYDELGTLTISSKGEKDHGRQKSERRRHKQKVGTKIKNETNQGKRKHSIRKK